MGSFPNCEIKLCDMESARVIQEDEHIREVIGTPDYVGEFIWLLLARKYIWWGSWSGNCFVFSMYVSSSVID